MCAAKSDVGFTPNSDRESGFPQKSCLLYPLKQTDAVQNQMSAKGQKQTSSAQALWGILAVLRLERNRYDARLRTRRPRNDPEEPPIGARQRLSAFLAASEKSAQAELFDLVIIDEAHYLRNPETAANSPPHPRGHRLSENLR